MVVTTGRKEKDNKLNQRDFNISKAHEEKEFV